MGEKKGKTIRGTQHKYEKLKIKMENSTDWKIN